MSRELLTIIADVFVSVAIEAITLWIAPEYQSLAHIVVAGLQAVAVGFIAEFRAERKIAAMRTEIHSLMGR